MRKQFFFLFILPLLMSSGLVAQDTLPRISVKPVNNLVVISWKNTYGAKISNILIQRSADSLAKFTTIGTVLNPLNRENGFVDSKIGSTPFFYRLFIAFEGGRYLFTKSSKPQLDTIVKVTPLTTVVAPIIVPVIAPVNTLPNVPVVIHQPVVTKTPITKPPVVVPIAPPPIELPEEINLLPETKIIPKPVPVGFVPSKFIFTDKNNNLVISLPDAEKEKFSLKFFNEKEKLVFEIKNITEPYLIAEKVNFLRTGWYYYSLFNDGILLEKYKFYISKDGKAGPPPPEPKK